jgi:hypothetical protein
MHTGPPAALRALAGRRLWPIGIGLPTPSPNNTMADTDSRAASAAYPRASAYQLAAPGRRRQGVRRGPILAGFLDEIKDRLQYPKALGFDHPASKR